MVEENSRTCGLRRHPGARRKGSHRACEVTQAGSGLTRPDDAGRHRFRRCRSASGRRGHQVDADHGPHRQTPHRSGHPPAERTRFDDPQAWVHWRHRLAPALAAGDRHHHAGKMNGPAMILIVEDNEANRLLAGAVLEREGYRVEMAGNAQEALDRLAIGSPDLILMDVQMPGMDGLTLTRRLKNDTRTADIPVIALTALAMTGDRELTLEAGCSGYISKPINTRTFASEVSKYLPRG